MEADSNPLVAPILPPLYNYNGLNFALYRQAIKTNVPIKTFSTDTDPNVVQKEEIITAMRSRINIDLLTQLIISRNSIGLNVDVAGVTDKVSTIINSWINMGKFNNLNSLNDSDNS